MGKSVGRDLRKLETFAVAHFMKAKFGSRYSWFWADIVGEVSRLLGYHTRPSKLRKRDNFKGEENGNT